MDKSDNFFIQLKLSVSSPSLTDKSPQLNEFINQIRSSPELATIYESIQKDSSSSHGVESLMDTSWRCVALTIWHRGVSHVCHGRRSLCCFVWSHNAPGLTVTKWRPVQTPCKKVKITNERWQRDFNHFWQSFWRPLLHSLCRIPDLVSHLFVPLTPLTPPLLLVFISRDCMLFTDHCIWKQLPVWSWGTHSRWVA